MGTQWLHTRAFEENSNLIDALRQCDGEHVQCVLTVRDDFWMGVTHFMDELEIESVAMHQYINDRRWRELSLQIGKRGAAEEFENSTEPI